MTGFRRKGAGRKGRFLVLFFFVLCCVSFVLFWNAERKVKAAQDLSDWLFHQTEALSWKFWCPGIFLEAEKNAAENRLGTQDVDPSYVHYIEGKQKRQEYQRFRQMLRENSRLFSARWQKSAPEEENQEKQNRLTQKEWGTPERTENAERQDAGRIRSSPAALKFGTVAGLSLFEKKLDASGVAAGRTYLKEQLADYDFLMKHFYTVHPTAAAGRDLMQAEVFLETDLRLEASSTEEPQILIYHTHSQEEYQDYHTGNKQATVVAAGDYLTRLLEKKGYRVIHDTSFYDLQGGTLDRSKAYNYALEGISGILQKYPSIQVVLDVHRDGVPEEKHLVSEIRGKQTARLMFFNGTSETPDGPIAYLPNPCRSENLAFSFQLKLCADALYPDLTRTIYLKGLRYNQHLRPRSALIEVGAQTNTLEEALNAMNPLAELLELVLGGV